MGTLKQESQEYWMTTHIQDEPDNSDIEENETDLHDTGDEVDHIIDRYLLTPNCLMVLCTRSLHEIM